METKTENVPYLIDLGSKKAGIYLSQLQIDLLLLVSCKTKEELLDYLTDDKERKHHAICGQFPTLKREDLPYITEKNLEEAKRDFFKKYQDSLISYLENENLSDFSKAEKKLSKCGISKSDIEECLTFISLGDIPGAYIYLASKYGVGIVDKINHFMLDDFENIKSITYEAIEALHNHIVNDDDLDTIVIATGKFQNNIFYNSKGTRKFDPFFTDKALSYCKKHDKHMRYHALVDYSNLTKYHNDGKDKRSRTKILAELKQFIIASLSYIESNNAKLSDGTNCINVLEVFNELVEYNLPEEERDKPYEMAWEKYFGITIEDLMSCFEGMKKLSGVEYMYNETLLQEGALKRKKVLEVFNEIERINPNFLDVFGDQMHLNSGDVNTPEQLGNISEEFELLRTIEAAGKKIECTEFDFHVNKTTVEKVKNLTDDPETLSKVANIKTKMIANLSSLAKKSGVKFERTTYWSLFDTVDRNLVRTNKRREETGAPLFTSMYAGLFGTGANINKIASLIPGHITSKKSTSKPKTEDDEVISMNDREKEIYQTMCLEIRQKNPEIDKKAKETAKKLELKRQENEPYKPNGFISFIIVLLVIALVIIGLSIVALLLVWG